MKTLFPFQEVGRKFLADKRHALLGDDMGLGKSAQSIRAADDIGAKNILVISPATARKNWENEFSLFSGMERTTTILRGREAIPSTYNHGLVITSPNMASWAAPALKKTRWDAVILDEAHFFKSAKSDRTWALLGPGGIVHNTDRTWLLSGTPAPNHAGELWVFLFVFGRTKLSYDEFTKRYCRFAGSIFDGRIVGTRMDMVDELKAMLAPFMLRRLKRDVLPDLPEMYFTQCYVEKDLNAFTDKDQLQEAATQADYIKGVIASGQFAQDPAMFAKSVSTLRKILGIQKVKGVADLLESELENWAYKKIGIFAIHKEVIKKLHERLNRFGVAKITGDTPDGQRQDAITRFQNDPNCRVFIGNILAAGTSITLTAGSQVALVEPDFVPGNNAQAIDRFRRIGQKNAVHVRTFAIENSLDTKITAILKRKTQELTELFDQPQDERIFDDVRDQSKSG